MQTSTINEVRNALKNLLDVYYEPDDIVLNLQNWFYEYLKGTASCLDEPEKSFLCYSVLHDFFSVLSNLSEAQISEICNISNKGDTPLAGPGIKPCLN